jgi:hypothetical protein
MVIFIVLLASAEVEAQKSEVKNVTCFGIAGNEIGLQQLRDSLSHGALYNFVKPVTSNTVIVSFTFAFMPADTTDPKHLKLIGSVSGSAPANFVLDRLLTAQAGDSFAITDILISSYGKEYPIAGLLYTIR